MSNTSNLSPLQKLLSQEVHHMTMHTKGHHDIVLAGGEGSYLFSNSGERYVDLCAGFGALSLGHRSLQEITKDFDTNELVHGLGDLYGSTSKSGLLEELNSLFPATQTRSAVFLGGAQAVEFALKTAYLNTGKRRVLALNNAYHGLEFGAIDVTHWKKFKTPFEKLPTPFDVVHLSEAQLVSLPSAEWRDVSAVIVEPIQGRGGIQETHPLTLSKLRQKCDEHGCLLIYDEIFCGLGRTGRWHHSTQNADADITCFGKALGGGMPISAVVMKERFSELWPDLDGESIHTATFFGHPLSCKIALNTLRRIRLQGLPSRAIALGEKVKDLCTKYSASQKSTPITVRQHGLMIGLDLNIPGEAVKLMHKLRTQNIIAIPAGPSASVLSITPALNIDETLLLSSVSKILEVVAAST